eukprot:765617-Hanusia_phi.AAC.5
MSPKREGLKENHVEMFETAQLFFTMADVDRSSEVPGSREKGKKRQKDEEDDRRSREGRSQLSASETRDGGRGRRTTRRNGAGREKHERGWDKDRKTFSCQRRAPLPCTSNPTAGIVWCVRLSLDDDRKT